MNTTPNGRGEKGTHARDEPDHGGGLSRSPTKDTVTAEATESVDCSPECPRRGSGRRGGCRTITEARRKPRRTSVTSMVVRVAADASSGSDTTVKAEQEKCIPRHHA